MINLKINGKDVSVEKGTTILEAAEKIDVTIPTLCHLNLHDIQYVNQQASCRVCVVEEVGKAKLIPACATVCKEGMDIRTDSRRAVRARRTIVELLLSNHPNSCLTCAMNLDCELQKLAHDLGIREIHYEGEKNNFPIDDNSFSIIRDQNKCVLCKRCETMCNEVQTVNALTDIGRGFDTSVGAWFNKPMSETTCTFCGQCVAVCPTGALTEMNYIKKVWDAINHPDKIVFVQTAPAVRVALGEEFGYPAGTSVTGKMVSALRQIGFDKVFDTNFAADLTIMEEATEFIERLKNDKLPILTSCCPSWVNFIEQQFPDMLDIPSTCKSPHEMFGAMTKTYLCQKLNIDPEKVVLVSIMPCVAKKYEAARSNLMEGEVRDVDYVLTTRELAIMIKETGIDFRDLEEDTFDNPMGLSTGAGDIFGASGGVIEATVRTAYYLLTDERLRDLEFSDLRGIRGIKEAEVDIKGKKIRIAVANGLGNARKLLESIRSGQKQYEAIEIMACPGGCIGGAGQPYHHGDLSILRKRAEALYDEDRDKKMRYSYENPDVLALYKEFLGEPNSPKAHQYLHTSYTPRPAR